MKSETKQLFATVQSPETGIIVVTMELMVPVFEVLIKYGSLK
jgi:hypothetical protein